MNYGASIQTAGEGRLTRQDLKAQLAHHVAQQSRSKQVFHKWMKVLEVASLGVVAAAFALAMYVSINNTVFQPNVIAAAWFTLPVSATPLMSLLGLHGIVLRAFLPVILPGKPQPLATGSRAVWSGVGHIVLSLAVGAFWGALAWALWAESMGVIMGYMRVLGTALGFIIPAAIVLSIVQKIFRLR